MLYNPDELEKRITSLPNEIYQEEKKVIKAKEDFELEKIKYGAAFADALLGADRPNATEKRQYAELLTTEQKKDVLKSEIEYEKSKALLRAKEAEFTALRKVSAIEIALMNINCSGN